jgi:hypothetical protein
MATRGHGRVGFEVLGRSSHFLHLFFELSHFLHVDPQILTLFARFSVVACSAAGDLLVGEHFGLLLLIVVARRPLITEAYYETQSVLASNCRVHVGESVAVVSARATARPWHRHVAVGGGIVQGAPAVRCDTVWPPVGSVVVDGGGQERT